MSDTPMTPGTAPGTDSQRSQAAYTNSHVALSKIIDHEKVCAERYEQINAGLARGAKKMDTMMLMITGWIFAMILAVMGWMFSNGGGG